MCTKSIRSYTNARFISKVYPTKFVNYYKCGFCSECIAEKKREFQLRAYYHAKEFLSYPDSFVLFDTLTYRDQDLTYLSDFCPLIEPRFDFARFNRGDIRDFFKNLNTQLVRLGYDVKDNFHHLLTSEYGARPDCTHRPHYHILFYSRVPGLDPMILSYLIGEYWPYGRTDGCWYKGADYVRYNRVFRSLKNDLVRISNYVGKYVSKDLYITFKLMRRVLKAAFVQDPNWTKTYDGRLWFRSLCDNVLPFHLQSDGFGLSIIDNLSDQDRFTDSVSLPTSDKHVVSRVPLPMYIKRKLYYDLKIVDGRLQYQLNANGVNHRLESFERSVDLLAARFKSYKYKSPAREIAKYVLLRRGLLMDKLSASGDDLSLQISFLNRSRYDYQFQKDNGLLWYGRLTERDSYNLGRYISECERSGDLWTDLIDKRSGRCWSPEEFYRHPPVGYVVGYDPVFESWLSDYESWSRDFGDSVDFLNWKRSKLQDEYKKSGLLNEFV